MSGEHVCQQAAIIKEITGKIHNQKTLGEETFAKIQEVEDSLIAHREAQQLHENELAVFMTTTNANTTDMMKIINEKLLPAYKREEKAEIAKEWIKEQAKSGKFWMGILASIAATLGILGWIARQSIK